MKPRERCSLTKKPEKTLNLHLRIILGKKTVYNNLKIKNNKQNIAKTSNAREENLISRITTLLD